MHHFNQVAKQNCGKYLKVIALVLVRKNVEIKLSKTPHKHTHIRSLFVTHAIKAREQTRMDDHERLNILLLCYRERMMLEAVSFPPR